MTVKQQEHACVVDKASTHTGKVPTHSGTNALVPLFGTRHGSAHAAHSYPFSCLLAIQPSFEPLRWQSHAASHI